MKMQKERMFLFVVVAVFVSMGLVLPGLIFAGDLEPGATPGPTMKTLDHVHPTWSQKLDSSERFELVLDDQAVLDKETGLVWAQNANQYATKTWEAAIIQCRDISIGGRKGWRLPTVEELASLVEVSDTNQGLPINHPFSNVQSDLYWSSTEYEFASDKAWLVHMGNGGVGITLKNGSLYIWPVRAGN
jgi:hypothetical protein